MQTMTVYIYPMNMDTDLPRVTDLLHSVGVREDAGWEAPLWQVVAVADGGAIIGYAVATRTATMPTDHLRLRVVVDPGENGVGIAAMLYDDLIQFAWEIGATTVELAGRVAVRDRVRVATRRGLRLLRCSPLQEAECACA